jgi:hypothetical protein
MDNGALSVNNLDVENTPHALGWYIIISIVLISLLAISMFIFFYYSNTPNLRNITLVNNDAEMMNVLITSKDLELPIFKLNSKAKTTFQAWPGTEMKVYAYTDSDVHPLTYAYLTLSDMSGNGQGTIILNGVTYSNLNTGTNNVGGLNNYDSYGVSLEKGYNIAMTIYPNNMNYPNESLREENLINVNNNPNSIFSDIYTCSGPVWYQYISKNNQYFPCPKDLSENGNCINPCKQLGGDYCKCESDWPDINNYYVFSSACPTCRITTCDTTNYTCSRNDINNHHAIDYTIEFMPALGTLF